jgi:hypothetical protein
LILIFISQSWEGDILFGMLSSIHHASTCHRLKLLCLSWPIFFKLYKITRNGGLRVFLIFVFPELWGLIPWKIFCCKYSKSCMAQLFISFYVSVIVCFFAGPSWLWSYGSWIYNYLCNQYLSPLMLWVRITLRRYNMW